MSDRAERAHIPHQPALDGLRGLAVIGVILFHGGRLTGGYLGVDAFFVLSGFLITSLLLAERASTGSISLRDFWVRRVRRLVPALLLVIRRRRRAAALALNPLLELPHWFGDDEERHMRVLMAAELGALSAIRARLIRLQ